MPSLIYFIPVALSSTPPDYGEASSAPVAAPWIRPVRDIMDRPPRNMFEFMQHRLPPRGGLSREITKWLLNAVDMPAEEFNALNPDAPADGVPVDPDVIPRVGDCLHGVIPDTETVRLDIGAPIAPGDVVTFISTADLQVAMKVFLGIEGDTALFFCSRPYAAFAIPLSYIRHVEKADVVPTLPPIVAAMVQGGEWENPPRGSNIMASYNRWLLDGATIMREMKSKPVSGAQALMKAA